ncbi:MAG: PTS sugar transporter subunit IIA [Halioglobus sp.]
MLDLSAILTPGRVACRVQGGSKKRLFETIAKRISEDQVSLPYNLVLSSLIAREKLGCTGLGQGIAIPHCRVENCTHALGTLFTLEEAIGYDAPDDKPVDILFVLLVPQEAQQQHLDILAGLAGLFNNPAFCEQVRSTRDSASLYAAVTSWSQ